MRALSHSEVAAVFNCTFSDHSVVMHGGYREPMYIPGMDVAEIRYTLDHTASALHEAAHWCIAGRRRRRNTDYGYFCEPPPRSGMHRVRFEDVEIEAQSVEVLLAEAAGSQFQPSADDVDVPLFLLEAFSSRILERARERRQVGLPKRADKFRAALCLERNRTRMLMSGG